MVFLYLLINLCSVVIPLGYSFEKKMRFIQWWKPTTAAIALVAFPFLIWDVVFTSFGVWGFNPTYHMGITLWGLPLEELLFFFCIPYACLFTHYAVCYFWKNLFLTRNVNNAVSVILFFVSILVVFIHNNKLYTMVNFSLFALCMLYARFYDQKVAPRFFITWLVILLPFLLVNGLLTGSFIEGEVVWYNPEHMMGIRVFTIPLEDFFYTFNLLYPSLILFEKAQQKLRIRESAT